MLKNFTHISELASLFWRKYLKFFRTSIYTRDVKPQEAQRRAQTNHCITWMWHFCLYSADRRVWISTPSSEPLSPILIIRKRVRHCRSSVWLNRDSWWKPDSSRKLRWKLCQEIEMRTGYQERVVCSDSSSDEYQAILGCFHNNKDCEKIFIRYGFCIFLEYAQVWDPTTHSGIQTTWCMKRGSWVFPAGEEIRKGIWLFSSPTWREL